MNNQKIITVRGRKLPFLSILKIFWVVIPLVYIMYIWLKMQIEQIGIQQFSTENVTFIIKLLFSFLMPFSSYFLFIQPQEEQEKQGKVGMYLKGMLVQQFITGNIVGVVLVYLSHRQLPSRENLQQKKITGDVIGLLVFQFAVSIIGIFGLIMIAFN